MIDPSTISTEHAIITRGIISLLSISFPYHREYIINNPSSITITSKVITTLTSFVFMVLNHPFLTEVFLISILGAYIEYQCHEY
jgi:hypothetical protein